MRFKHSAQNTSRDVRQMLSFAPKRSQGIGEEAIKPSESLGDLSTCVREKQQRSTHLFAPPRNFWNAAESRISFSASKVEEMKALLQYPC